MSLIDKLMAIDKGEFAKEKTAEMPAKHISAVMGETQMIKVQAISGDQFTDISTRLMNKKGDPDYSRSYDINALLVVEGLVEPSAKSKELQKHFGCATPKELVKILFPGSELTEVANKITELSGFSQSDKDVEDEVKN